jgi:hypothetical protein
MDSYLPDSRVFTFVLLLVSTSYDSSYTRFKLLKRCRDRRSCICVLEVSILPLFLRYFDWIMEGVSILSVSTILRLDFGSVLTHTACYFCFFISLSVITKYLKRKELTFKTASVTFWKQIKKKKFSKFVFIHPLCLTLFRPGLRLWQANLIKIWSLIAPGCVAHMHDITKPAAIKDQILIRLGTSTSITSGRVKLVLWT